MTSDIKRHIKELISGSENSEVEFKSAKGGLPESFWETFSAFANTNGGIIVLGIKEKNGIFMPDGLNKQQIDTYKTSNPQLSSSASFLRLNVLSSLN